MPKWKGLFEQTVRWLGLVVLSVAILLVFGSVAPHDQRQAALEATSPPRSPTPIAKAYPPPLPPPSRTPEAYPPPTFLPPPTVPAATETATPTPAPTPTPFISGLRLLWAEAALTDGVQHAPTFLLADVGNLSSRLILYPLPGTTQLVRATLSSDESKIAYTTLSRPGGDPGIEGTLWVVNLDGSGQRELASVVEPRGRPGQYPAWSPDSRLLAYTKYAFKSAPSTDQKREDPYRTELHVVAADGSWTEALVADDAEKPALIGWTADGKVLYSRPVGQGEELWTVDVAGNRTLITLMHTEPIVVYPRLSPDHRKMIYVMYDYSGVTKGLVYLSVDGHDKRGIDFIDPETARRFIGWASNDEIILHIGLAQYRILDVQTGACRDITVSPAPNAESDSFLSMSPDGEWLVTENYPKAGADLLKINSQVRVRITDNWLLFLGWLKGGV